MRYNFPFFSFNSLENSPFEAAGEDFDQSSSAREAEFTRAAVSEDAPALVNSISVNIIQDFNSKTNTNNDNHNTNNTATPNNPDSTNSNPKIPSTTTHHPPDPDTSIPTPTISKENTQPTPMHRKLNAKTGTQNDDESDDTDTDADEKQWVQKHIEMLTANVAGIIRHNIWLTSSSLTFCLLCALGHMPPHFGQQNNRLPPAWGPEMAERTPSRQYSREVLIWSIMNSDLSDSRKAAAIVSQLRGAAAELRREIPVATLSQRRTNQWCTSRPHDLRHAHLGGELCSSWRKAATSACTHRTNDILKTTRWEH